MIDLFAKGCLVQFETSCWTARRKVPSRTLLNGVNQNVDASMVAASKRLVDGDTLSKVESLRGKARAWLYSQSLPFPIDGVVFVPVDSLERIDAKLSEFRTEYEAAVDAFCADYPALREAARSRLGSLYSEADYPDDVQPRFAFSWRFLSLAPADSKILSPALVQAEQEKFRKLVSDAADAAVTELRTRFAACVDHMVDRLSGSDGKPNVFRDSLVGNLREFLDGFDALNVCGDHDLAALVERARGAIDGVAPVDLRDDEQLREHITGQFTNVQAALDGMIQNRPTRKVRIAVPAAQPEAPAPDAPAAPASDGSLFDL
jgi:hypothetical protein